MAHCGFEGTAVNDAFSHPVKAMLAAIRGPRVVGPMAPELPFNYVEGAAPGAVATVSVKDIKRMSRESDEGQRAAATH
jgi:hypothetical protein